MEYILDAGKAVSCFNLTNQVNPCMNVYCQNCIVSFMEEKHRYEENQEESEDNKKPLNPENETDKKMDEAKRAKELEMKKVRRKLWLKASQNVIFICPCC